MGLRKHNKNKDSESDGIPVELFQILKDNAVKVKKVTEFQKTIYFCFIDYTKTFDCVDHNKLWKILKEMNTRPPYLPPKKLVCRAGSNS